MGPGLVSIPDSMRSNATRDAVRFVVVGQLLVWPSQRRADDVIAVNRLLQAGVRSLPSNRVLYWRYRSGF